MCAAWSPEDRRRFADVERELREVSARLNRLEEWRRIQNEQHQANQRLLFIIMGNTAANLTAVVLHLLHLI